MRVTKAYSYQTSIHDFDKFSTSIMLNFVKFLFFVIALGSASSTRFYGSIVGIPEDAIEAAKSNVESHVANGLNFQSRFDVVFHLLTDSPIQLTRVPVKENYDFVAELRDGQYQLEINSHDFNIRDSRYKVIVAGDKVTAYQSKLASPSFNESSVSIVSSDSPLQVLVEGYLEYYESPEGKLTAMIMNSPLGIILKNRTLTILFSIGILVTIAPTVLSYISPELAAEVKKAQTETTQVVGESKVTEGIDSLPIAQGSQLSGAYTKKAKKRK